MDQTGLSQKAGPVVSTISIGEPEPGRVDVLIGFDLLASVTAANLSGLDPETSLVVASTTVTPTGRMVGRVATANLDPTPMVAELDRRSRRELNRYVDASRAHRGLLGDAVTANVFLLGVAYQAGVVPVKASSIEAAIDLNGTAVDLNTQAFRWGRLWAVDPARVEQQAGLRADPAGGTEGLEEFADDAELQRMLAVRVAELTAYQDRPLRRPLRRGRAPVPPGRAGGGDGRRLHPNRRPPAPPADGLQGRVRGGPPAARQRRPGGAHLRLRREGDLEPPPADAAGHGHEAQAEARPVDAARRWSACGR